MRHALYTFYDKEEKR